MRNCSSVFFSWRGVLSTVGFRAIRDERREYGSPRQWRRYRSHHAGNSISDQTARNLLTGIRQRAFKLNYWRIALRWQVRTFESLVP
jgi:hypothetical protein